MIIYLSSYPRSGNTWVRHLVRHYLDRRSSSVYREAEPNLVLGVDGRIQGSLFSDYVSQLAPTRRFRRLVNGIDPALDESLRRQLASVDEHFFIKTHQPPFPRYLDGECVVQIVRHPGSALWSYFHFVRDFTPLVGQSVPLENVIRGDVGSGCWSQYHAGCLRAQEQLGDRFVLCSYEDLSESEMPTIQRIASLAGLPIRREPGSFDRFESYQAQAPKFYRAGRVDEWRKHFTADQLALLRARHGVMMSRLGFADE